MRGEFEAVKKGGFQISGTLRNTNKTNLRMGEGRDFRIREFRGGNI